MKPHADISPYVTLTCRTCRQIVLYSSNHELIRQYARQHHGTHPGHWLQATLQHPSSGTETTIDVPNREAN